MNKVYVIMFSLSNGDYDDYDIHCVKKTQESADKCRDYLNKELGFGTAYVIEKALED